MKKPADRTSILVIVIGLMAIYLFIDRLSHPSLPYIAFTIGFLSLLSKEITNFILFIWNKIGMILGWINTRIILGFIFYVALYPLALISRIAGKDALKLKRLKRTSLYTTRDHLYTKKDLENIW